MSAHRDQPIGDSACVPPCGIEATDISFEAARAMPPSVYTSPDVLALEQQCVFRRQWLCVGRASAIPQPGDYLTTEIAHQPIVVLRDRDGVVRAFSNVCLHRMSVLLEGSGRVHGGITCPYHAWTYNLDGTLRAAPHMQRSPAFRNDAYRLPELRVETWLGWIYVTLDAALPPVATHLAPLADLVGQVRHAGLCRNVPRGTRLGHQLEAPRRELHGKLPSADAAPRDRRAALQDRGDGVPARVGCIQLSLDHQGSDVADRQRASGQHAPAGPLAPHHRSARRSTRRIW